MERGRLRALPALSPSRHQRRLGILALIPNGQIRDARPSCRHHGPSERHESAHRRDEDGELCLCQIIGMPVMGSARPGATRLQTAGA